MRSHPEIPSPGIPVGETPAPESAGGESGAVRRALSAVRVVLVEPSHPGNIGAVARAMKGMGLTRLYLVRPRCFPNAEATARAAGADDLLVGAVVCGDLVQALGDCTWAAATSARARRLSWPELDPAGCAREALVHAPADVALVFGREAAGLTNAEIDLCQATVRIPSDEGFPSLNLGASVQVLAYELRCAALAGSAAGSDLPSPSPSRARDPRARGAELDAFYAHLERTLVDIGYLNPSAPRLLMRRLRRLFNRAGMLRSEIAILRGVFRAAQRSVRSPASGVSASLAPEPDPERSRRDGRPSTSGRPGSGAGLR